MKILFSLSKKHFDPIEGMKIRHSTGILSQLFYEAIKDLGDITVIDSEDVSIKGQEFDLLIGLPRNFDFLTNNNKIKVATCFPNICEGNALKQRLLEEAHRLGCKMRDAYAPTNYYHADHLFVIGGEWVINGFVEAGIPMSKITPLYWKSGIPDFKFRPKNKRTVFLHSATTFGLRKGVWWVIEDFKKANLDAELWLMGTIQKEKFWVDYINEACKDPRIKNLGYISNHDQAYVDVLHKADFIVFPSFGEGEPGTVIEAMEAGCVPLVTQEAGIEGYIYSYIRGLANNFTIADKCTQEAFTVLQKRIKNDLDTKYDNKKFIQTVRDKIKELCHI